jgi:hypothetical protein
MPKFSSVVEKGITRKLQADKKTLSHFYAKSKQHYVYYSRKVGYFLQVLDFSPDVRDGRGNRRAPSEFKELTFRDPGLARCALACLNANLFYWFVTVFSDCRHVNKREVDAFPVDLKRLWGGAQGKPLSALSTHLMSELDGNSERRKMTFKHDSLTVQCIFPKHSKSIIDKIETVLAKHYGFTDDELDFIINYDIKYRMGRDNGGDEDEA